MRINKNVPALHLALTCWVAVSLSACNTSFGATASQSSAPLVLQATIESSASGRSVSIPQAQLPDALQQAQEVTVALDNSNSVVTASRNADQSITFALGQGVKADSNGNIQVILIADGQRSFFMTLKTGSLLALDAGGIQVLPATQVLKGTQLTLTAPLQNPEKAEDYHFTWFWAPAATGPWTPIAASGLQAQWEVPQAGNYYVRLDMQAKGSTLSSTYITPKALVTVNESDTALSVQPVSGDVLLGDVVQVMAHPEAFGVQQSETLNYRWAYAQSPQGPFIPIEEEGQQIAWEPPGVGSFYLRTELRQGGALVASYVDSKARVKVANSNQFVQLSASEITRGERVHLRSALQTAAENQASALDYTWFYALSPQGPFALIESTGAEADWYPEQTGQFYVRLKTRQNATGEERTYTSSKALLTVTDDNAFFTRTPANGQVARGAAVNLQLQVPLDNVKWSYAAAAQGPFVVIPGTGSSLQWTPAQAGSFYVRAEGTNAEGRTVSFTSATAQVFVSERDNIILTDPASASLNLGSSVQLRADLPDEAGNQYFWSYGTTANGPWSPVNALDNRYAQKSLRWIPTSTGNFFIKVDVHNPQSQSTVSFVSPTPKVFVEERTPFFKTSPDPAFIGTKGAVTLRSSFAPLNQSINYAWSYGPSTAGPFTAIGGSIQPEIVWREPGLVGSYYIKLDATLTGTSQVLSFISPKPLVFVSSGTGSQPSFGVTAIQE